MSFQAYLDNIQEKTGKTPADFKELAEKKKPYLKRENKEWSKSYSNHRLVKARI